MRPALHALQVCVACNAAESEQPEMGRPRAAQQVLRTSVAGALQDATRCNGAVEKGSQTLQRETLLTERFVKSRARRLKP